MLDMYDGIELLFAEAQGRTCLENRLCDISWHMPHPSSHDGQCSRPLEQRAKIAASVKASWDARGRKCPTALDAFAAQMKAKRAAKRDRRAA